MKTISSTVQASRWLTIILCSIAVSVADAAITNQYTFNDGTADDAVGGAHGTIVDNTGISGFTGGALDLTANNGAGSAQDFTDPSTVGAFVNLPNGIFTDAVTAGTFGQVTIETWLTVQENRDWARVVDFGASGPGEDVSGNSSATEYVFIAPQRGGGAGVVAASTHNSGGDVFVDGSGPLPVNTQQHVVLTLDQNDFTGGFEGTARLYVNNAAPIVGSIAGGLFLDSINDINNYIGRAQWPDPLFDGLVDEVRLHDVALSDAEVNQSFVQGVVPVPLPVLQVNRDTGEITISNPADTAFSLTGYSITSANGGLDPSGWNSIDAGNTFDPDGNWTGTQTTSEITETVTSGATDGGTISGGNTATISSAWAISPLSSDLQFSYTLNGGTAGSGQIVFTGDDPIRSDLNGDGEVTVADWSLFAANHGEDFVGDLAVEAYLKGDLDGDFDSDYSDFIIFKQDFIAAQGPAAFAALRAIPEPATASLVLFASLALAFVSRPKRGL